MRLGSSIRGGVKWLLAGNLGGQILQFLFGVVLARLLVPADFGLIVTVQILTGFVGLVSSGGLGQALVQAKEADQHDFNVVFSLQIIIGVGIFVGFWVSAPLIARTFGNPLYEELTRVSAISFLLRPLLNTRIIWLHRKMRFRERSLISLATAVVTGLSSIAMAKGGMGVWSLVLSGIVGSLISLALLDRVADRRPRIILNLATTRRFGAYGAKVSLNDLANYFNKQASNAIISRLAGPSAVGLFNKGESLAWLPFSTLSASVYDPVFRSMASVQGNPDQVKYLFYRMINLMVLYTLPFYIGLAWMAEPLILFVYGDKWLPSADPLRIVSSAGLLICVGHPCGAVLAAMNRLGREVWVQLSTGFVVAAACYFGLTRWGIVGAAWGVFAGLAYSTPIMYYLATRCFSSNWRDLVRALAPGLKLNAILLVSLFVLESMLPAHWRVAQPHLYMLLVAGGAGLAYAAAFLFLPPDSLAEEAQRWRKVLRLSQRSK